MNIQTDITIMNIQTDPDAGCSSAGGVCRTSSDPCIGGSYKRDLCGGPAVRRCCVHFPVSKYI